MRNGARERRLPLTGIVAIIDHARSAPVTEEEIARLADTHGSLRQVRSRQAAAAGEFGIVFCICLVRLIAFIVIRALFGAQKQSNLFARLAASTLAIQFGLQCGINLAVNLNLIPPKGMTLPFVSYGGTSMIAVAFGAGLMLALTRKRFPGSQDI